MARRTKSQVCRRAVRGGATICSPGYVVRNSLYPPAKDADKPQLPELVLTIKTACIIPPETTITSICSTDSTLTSYAYTDASIVTRTKFARPRVDETVTSTVTAWTGRTFTTIYVTTEATPGGIDPRALLPPGLTALTTTPTLPPSSLTPTNMPTFRNTTNGELTYSVMGDVAGAPAPFTHGEPRPGPLSTTATDPPPSTFRTIRAAAANGNGNGTGTATTSAEGVSEPVYTILPVAPTTSEGTITTFAPELNPPPGTTVRPASTATRAGNGTATGSVEEASEPVFTILPIVPSTGEGTVPTFAPEIHPPPGITSRTRRSFPRGMAPLAANGSRVRELAMKGMRGVEGGMAGQEGLVRRFGGGMGV